MTYEDAKAAYEVSCHAVAKAREALREDEAEAERMMLDSVLTEGAKR